MINKSNGGGAYGADVAKALWERNGTFTWLPSDPQNGEDLHDNIYQALAAAIHAPGGSRKEKTRCGDLHEAEARSGTQSLSKWLDEQWGVPLYRCTNKSTGNLVVAITVHPDLVVNSATGEMAKDQQRRRDLEALKGQARSTLKRMIRDEGEDIRDKLAADMAKTLLTYETPTARRANQD
jgi:hypothetical protein